MKTKLLFAFVCFLFTGTLYTNAQQIWAVTPQGGASSGGTIVRMNPDGTGFEVEFSYACSATSGCMPMGNLMQASDGQLYGTCYLGGQYASCTIDRYDPLTGTYYDIYDFDIINGDFPQSGLIEGHNGKLYGVASAGGTSQAGVIYSIELVTYIYTPLFSFGGYNGTYPYGCPILKNGVLYGMTDSGGMYAHGVLYSFNIANNTYTVLHHFNIADGIAPKGSLYEASNGIFYGMTSGGGANNAGTIFSLDPATNVFTVLYSFNTAEGSGPEGTFMQAADGKLYAVTKMGGANNAGVIFSYDITSSTYTKLYDFVVALGAAPTGNLYQSANMMLYGTTSNGGYASAGVCFSYDLGTGTYTDLVHFNGINGSHPAGGFVMVDVPTSTQRIAQNVFSIYPNPVSDEINISFVNETHRVVALRNVTGEIVYSAENYSLLETMDISHLSKGVYTVEIKEDSGKITTQKFVKM